MLFSHQLARADGLHAGGRRSRRGLAGLRAALSSAAAARQQPRAGAMRRPYTIEYYAALVDDIRARIPHASIGSDIIVGFPGETDDDFEQLASYLERSPLTHLHVFPYSDRPGTAAPRCPARCTGGRPRARSSPSRDLGAVVEAFPRVAGRHGPPRPDARGRLARRDRELSEGADSAGPGAQRVGQRQDRRAG